MLELGLAFSVFEETQRMSSHIIIWTDIQTIKSPVTLMMTFDPVPTAPTAQQVVWNVMKFRGDKPEAGSVAFSDKLLFAAVSVDSKNIISPLAYQVLNLGQRTTLTTAPDHSFKFTPPTPGLPGQLNATNRSGATQSLSIGYVNPGNNLAQSILVWQGIENHDFVEAIFTPILKIYVTAQYQESEIIDSGPIQYPVLLTHNILTLFPNTNYLLVQHPTGCYSLTPRPSLVDVPRPMRMILNGEDTEDFHRGKL